MFRHSRDTSMLARTSKNPKIRGAGESGVPEYQMTAVLWVKGILSEFYGVLPRSKSTG